MPSKSLWLVRDSQDLINWCTCEIGIAGSLPQLDCPWCGCGWLFSCIQCRKAFTFARAAFVDMSLDELASQDIQSRCNRIPTDTEVRAWIDSNAWMVANLSPGDRVVVLDGVILPTDHAGPLRIEGWHSRHELAWLPHTRALADPSVMSEMFRNADYWKATSVEREE